MTVTKVREKSIELEFVSGTTVLKYDGDETYIQSLQNIAGGTKGVDVVAFCGPGDELWLIEIKDYRKGSLPADLSELARNVAAKARDTLAGLVVLRRSRSKTKTFALDALNAATRPRKTRVVFHMETPRLPGRTLVSREKLLGDMTMKLRQQTKGVDPEAEVRDSAIPHTVWTARFV